MADNNFRSDRRRDPVKELARAPQLRGRLNKPRAYELDERRHDENACDADDQPCAADEEYQNGAPRVRRRSLALVLAICSFAVVVAAGAFGYREMFGGSVPPTLLPITKASNETEKIAPARREQQAKNSDNAGEADTAITGSISAAVSAKRAGQSAADIAAEPNRAHLAAVPIGPANASSPATETPPVLGGGYAVQVTSQRSESRAQVGFRVLQAKYPNQLGGRQPIIRRVDLGATGTYYRTLVGPFASAEKAASFCNELKAAGGNCIIQKN